MPTPPSQEQRLALLLQYDGSAFAGSQSQPQLPTVQGALEQAVSKLTREQRRVSLAGRTDAGVHATGQVASFLTTSRLPPHRWIRGLNHFLPAALAVQALQPVSLEFDPRRNAIEREYHYDILVASQRRPLHEVRAWRVQPPFSVEAARDALTQFEGQHDFAAFTTTDQGRPTIRRLHEASITTSNTTTNTAIQDPEWLHAALPRRRLPAASSAPHGRRSRRSRARTRQRRCAAQHTRNRPPGLRWAHRPGKGFDVSHRSLRSSDTPRLEH